MSRLRVLAALVWLFAQGMSLAGCAAMPLGQRKVKLYIYAAASLNEPFEAIARQFESDQPGVDVILAFGGSQQLAGQIIESAQADVFASANQKQMDVLVSAGKAQASLVRHFASNRLVIIVPKDNPAGMGEVQNLTKPGQRLVLAAAEVPVGQYTLEFLDKVTVEAELGDSFRELVLQNVVSYENDVKAVLAKVVLGEADAGIVYFSDVSKSTAEKVIRIEIPERWNVTARYPISALSGSAQPELAEAFVDFVLSSQGQAILAQYGFLPAAP